MSNEHIQEMYTNLALQEAREQIDLLKAKLTEAEGIVKAAEALERLASRNVEPRKAADIALDHMHEVGRLLSELYEAVRRKRGE